MTLKKLLIFSLFNILAGTVFAQPTHVVTDPERKFKDVKEYMIKEEYALAYPLIKELMAMYPENQASNQSYLHEDTRFYYIVCGLKLMHPVSRDEAAAFIYSVNNEPRRQIMAFHLAHYYFLQNEFEQAIEYFDIAGYNNLSNEQIADAKFEKAYAYFNLKQFAQAKPLFDEIHQMPEHKYYIPANYYYGFISYYDRKYDDALKAFKLVESEEAYKGVVPYYITEIYYFQGKKDEALRYGESVLAKGEATFYEKQLKLLTGQVYFEKQQYQKALPLLEAYVNNSEKVSKEVLYELSFCYYVNGDKEKAINGFKQLSNERDSMGQNSMYLLGDLYLKTNQRENARNAFQYSAYNSSNKTQQQVSRFTYAKLSYELGYQDIALAEMKSYLVDYPNSSYESEAREILVSLLANTNNYREALGLYESYKNPTPAMQKVYPRILYGRAIEMLNDQQVDQADALLSKAIAAGSSPNVSAYAHFWKGEIAYRQQRYDDAIRSLDIFLKSGVPTQGEASPQTARYNAGYSWFQKENYKNALGYFEQVARQVGSGSSAMELDAYVRSADCHYMLRDFNKASGMYDAVINQALPQSDYATYQKAMIAGVKSGKDKIRILNAMSRQFPNSPMLMEVQMEIAQTYIADEQFRDAIPYLQQIINSEQGGALKPKAYLKTGLAYYNMNDNKGALNNYQQLIRKYPQSPESEEALTIIRDIYVEEGRTGEYLDLMKQNGVVVSVSEADSLTFTSANMKYQADDYQAAVNGFTQYISRYPDGAYLVDAHMYRADAYLKLKDPAKALADFAVVHAKGLSRHYERATLEAARITYFEQKDYASARKYFEALRTNTVNQDYLLEALRGLVRSYYQLKEYTTANEVAKDLLSRKGISTDDRAISYLVLGKSQQIAGDCPSAIASFKSVAAINKTAWGAEARYELANCQYAQQNYAAAEKGAMAVIKETGSYDLWVTKSYILLGDIFMKRKDYFNAKATYESVAANAIIPELKDEASRKLQQAVEEEKKQSKIGN